jgi:hypothetical protein
LKTALRWKGHPEQRQRIQMVLLRESGMTEPVIAEAMGVSLSTMNRATGSASWDTSAGFAWNVARPVILPSRQRTSRPCPTCSCNKSRFQATQRGRITNIRPLLP